MVGRLPALASTGQHQFQLATHPVLTDELLQAGRPQARVPAVLTRESRRAEDIVVACIAGHDGTVRLPPR